MLVSAVQQPESAICRHISPPPWASLPPACRSPLGHHRAPSWAPCASQRLPTGCFTRAGVHVPPPLAVCPVLSFPCCVHWSTLCTCVSVLPCGEVHRYRFSGLCVYVLICGICFSPSDFMLYDRLWVLLHHCRWPSFFPFSGWILCYINVPHLLYCFLCQWTSRLISCSTMCVSLYSLMLW